MRLRNPQNPAPSEPAARVCVRAHSFVGEGDVIEQAVEDATRKLNEFLATAPIVHIDAGGRMETAYQISHGPVYVEAQQFGEVIHYVISACGPELEAENA